MEVVPSRSEIDTSRPFHSVREAVEVFGGDRCVGVVSRASSSNSSSSSSSLLQGCLKKLEEAMSELAQLKQRQSQMEMALSSITMQLGNGIGVLSSGLMKGKELAAAAPAMVGAEHAEEEEDGNRRVRSNRWAKSLEYLPSLSEALTIKMVEEDLGERKKMKIKKQQHKKHKRSATMSLVGGFFSKKDKNQVNNLTVPRKR